MIILGGGECGGESYPWDDREVGSFVWLGEWIRVWISCTTEIGGTFKQKEGIGKLFS